MFFYSSYLTFPSWVFAKPILCTLTPLILGFGGSAFIATRSISLNYNNIKKPSWAPPDWAFGPVWTTLWLLLGYASHRVWVRGMAAVDDGVVELTKQSTTLYTLEIVLLSLFIPLVILVPGFSAGGGKPFLEIPYLVLIAAMNLYLMRMWSHIDGLAPLLILPTTLWLTLATVLNVQIRRMWLEGGKGGKGM